MNTLKEDYSIEQEFITAHEGGIIAVQGELLELKEGNVRFFIHQTTDVELMETTLSISELSTGHSVVKFVKDKGTALIRLQLILNERKGQMQQAIERGKKNIEIRAKNSESYKGYSFPLNKLK